MPVNISIPSSGSDDENEPLAEYLKRKELEAMQRIDAIRGMLAPWERQLSEVRTAMKAIGVPPSSGEYVDALRPFLENPPPEWAASLETLVGGSFTIKQMIIFALRDHYRRTGATPSELAEYMRVVYSREIDRNSISPQLARLRDQAMVERQHDGRWIITAVGRRFGESEAAKED